MQFLLQVVSIVAALLVSRMLTVMVLRKTSSRPGQKPHPLSTPLGSSLLFAAIFVGVWFLISAILVLVWLAPRM